LLSSRLIMSFLWSYQHLPDIHRDISAEETCQIFGSSLIFCESLILCTTIVIDHNCTQMINSHLNKYLPGFMNWDWESFIVSEFKSDCAVVRSSNWSSRSPLSRWGPNRRHWMVNILLNYEFVSSTVWLSLWWTISNEYSIQFSRKWRECEGILICACRALQEKWKHDLSTRLQFPGEKHVC
jgi:hypothetical protein